MSDPGLIPWKRPDLFLPLPAAAGPWGSARRGRGGVALVQAGDLDELRQRVRGDPAIRFAWTPGDRHLRPVHEIPELAAEVEARGAEEARLALRKSLPPLAGTILLIAGSILLWPEDRDDQILVLLLLMFLGVSLWHEGVDGAVDAWKSRRGLERDPARWRALQANRIRFAVWVGARSLAATALVGAFVATYVAMILAGPERAVGRFGLVKEEVRAGEWWRLLSCAFLHGGVIHLFFNAAAGMSLARIARSLVGEATILLVFLLSAVAASVASTLSSDVTSLGASGGILGWGGLLMGLALRHRDLRSTGLVSNLMRWVVVLALIGVAGMGFIDNAAHAGGFLAGLAAGLWIARDRERPLPFGGALSRGGWVAVALVLGLPWLGMVAALLIGG